MTIINFELFKDQKNLEKEYDKYCAYCNKYFGTDVTPLGIFKRLYFAMKYLEGSVRGYNVFKMMCLDDPEYEKGILLFADWLESIVKDLRGEK